MVSSKKQVCISTFTRVFVAEFIAENINSFELKTGCLFPVDDVSRREIFIVKCGLIEWLDCSSLIC